MLANFPLTIIAQAVVLGAALIAGWVAMSSRVDQLEEELDAAKADIEFAERILQVHSDRIAYIRGIMLGNIPEGGDYGPNGEDYRHGGRRN